MTPGTVRCFSVFWGLGLSWGVLPSAGVDESFCGLGAEDEADTLFSSSANSFQALLHFAKLQLCTGSSV